MFYRYLRPLLFALPTEMAHSATLSGLRAAYRLGGIRDRFPQTKTVPVELMGLRFPNRLGVAAGLDKNGTCIDALGALGFGFIEIGTITPRPQRGNAKPRLFRLIEDEALINRMGFPNQGLHSVVGRLRRRRFAGICGVNIGKNADTPISSAVEDYLSCFRAVYDIADYVTINISSPNTRDLRRLQHGKPLEELLRALDAARHSLRDAAGRYVPLLVKLTVDLGEEELRAAARTALSNGIDGLIVSNTTLGRAGLRSASASEEGGLSGAPLFDRAKASIRLLRAVVGPQFPIIGVGGIQSGRDAVEFLEAGADLIQVYTGLVYRGPALIGEIARSISLSNGVRPIAR